MVTAATYQSMDHSSSLKKTRQHLQDSELGIASVLVDVKNSKQVQQAKKIIQPAKEALSHVENMLLDVRKRHTQEVSTFRNETSTLKSMFFESRKDLLNKFSLVDNTITDLKEKIESLIRDSRILSDLSNEVSKIQSFLKKLEETVSSTKKELDTFTTREKLLSVKQSEHDDQIKQLHTSIKEVSSKLSYAQVAAKNVSKVANQVGTETKSLHVGEKFNLPEQPPTLKEGGIHKVAPLSLVVNGAVLLHDIGYTTDKKGLAPLYYDPVTQRALIYQGK